MGWKERKNVRKKVASERIKELLKSLELHKNDEILSTNSIQTLRENSVRNASLF